MEQVIQPKEVFKLATPELKLFETNKDGTKYAVLTAILPNGVMAGYLANSSPQVLVIDAYNKTAYTFPLNTKNYLSADYVHEKICPKGSSTDAENTAELIRAVKTYYEKQ